MTIFDAINNAAVGGARNTFLGLDVGIPTSSSTDNTVYGNNAGHLIAGNSTNNTLIGSAAGSVIGTSLGANDNTAVGFTALTLSQGDNNTAVGSLSLSLVVSGFHNIGIGFAAGAAYTGNESSNICLGTIGLVGESNSLRLGAPFSGGSGVGEQLNCYIAGIKDNEQTDVGSFFLTLTHPVNSQMACINPVNFPGVIVTTYNTPGNYTWTKNARTKNVQIYGWAGGCGGGSGRKGANTIAGGGTGGGFGSVFFMECPASFLDATEPVVVGAGGNGGASQTSDNTDGNAGSAGGISYLGNFRPAINSVGGDPGVNGTGTGQWAWIYTNQQLWTNGNPTSGSGTTGNGNAATNAGIFGFLGMAGTGGGGGAGTGSFVGGGGGNVLNMAGTGTFLSGGVGGTNSPGSPGNDAPTGATSGGIICGGTGGGGGGTDSAHGYAGGLGGTPGGGGGGGGGGLNATFNSGAGGGGGNGQIIVLEFC